jgi:NADPH-dependent curcumin reductase CurA
MIATYNEDGRNAAPANYSKVMMKRWRIQGFWMTDYLARYPEAVRALTQLHLSGRLKWRTHEVHGLENAVAALTALFGGEILGKPVLHVSARGLS